ncbi:peptidylprolyl isomerase [Candidatus Zixiibacteriota bacterium]
MKLLKYILSFALFLTLTTNSFAQRETLDRIIAVIGDEVILASELANQIQLYALQTKSQPRSEEELLQWQEEILNQMVSDRLFLIAAKDDTSIVLRDEEIEEMLDEQVARISQNFNTYDEFLQALTLEGITIRELKKKYRKDVENQILKQRFIQKELYTISISKHEVEEFYTIYKDSIPAQPEGVRLAHLLLTYQPSDEVIDSVKQKTSELRQMILDGADFATISSQYSSSGAGVNGGDLGFLSRDDVVPEFARAAFSLSIGDISGVIRTQFGFHIIKCEGINEDKYKLRHVLLSVTPSADDTTRIDNLADSLLNECRTNGNFEELTKIFSDDEETKVQGGELGWFATAQLPPEFADAVSGWTEVEDIRGPLKTRFGVHILKLLEYQEERQFSMEEDYDQIKELARQSKTGQFVNEWVERMKQDVFIKFYE